MPIIIITIPIVDGFYPRPEDYLQKMGVLYIIYTRKEKDGGKDVLGQVVKGGLEMSRRSLVTRATITEIAELKKTGWVGDVGELLPYIRVCVLLDGDGWCGECEFCHVGRRLSYLRGDDKDHKWIHDEVLGEGWKTDFGEG